MRDREHGTGATRGGQRYRTDERGEVPRQAAGQGLLEYAIILGLMAVVAILALTLFGDQIRQIISMVAQ